MVDGLLLALADKEHAAVSKGLPAHLLWLSADELRKRGWELRQDTFVHLSRAAGAALSGLDALTTMRAARQIDQVAVALLRDLSFDDPRDQLISVAMLTCKLVEEGLFLDPRNQAVLVSLLLVDDAMDAGSAMPFNEHVLKRNVGKMLTKLNLVGYYTRFVQGPVFG